MWPIQLAFHFLISCRIFLCSLTLSNTFSFLTWSVQRTLKIAVFVAGAMKNFRISYYIWHVPGNAHINTAAAASHVMKIWLLCWEENTECLVIFFTKLYKCICNTVYFKHIFPANFVIFKTSNNIFKKHIKMVTQCLYRPGQALRFSRGWGSQISRHTKHEGGKVVSPTHRSPLPPRKCFWYSLLLEAESSLRSEGLSSGTEPANFRIVEQCHNQMLHRGAFWIQGARGMLWVGAMES